MLASEANLFEMLTNSVPSFGPMMTAHRRDCDEVLPHVLLADFVRFLQCEVNREGPGCGALLAAMPLLEEAMGSADEALSELIGVSFVENLNPDHPSTDAIREAFGPNLARQYAAVWPA
jgi:hypothetical protein